MKRRQERCFDEEIEKKKAQRKAMEESFWTRVRAKEKEKQQDKVQLANELSKRREDNSVNADRTMSVEPAESWTLSRRASRKDN